MRWLPIDDKPSKMIACIWLNTKFLQSNFRFKISVVSQFNFEDKAHIDGAFQCGVVNNVLQIL